MLVLISWKRHLFAWPVFAVLATTPDQPSPPSDLRFLSSHLLPEAPGPGAPFPSQAMDLLFFYSDTAPLLL